MSSPTYWIDIQEPHPIDIYQAARFVLGNDERGNEFASTVDEEDIPQDIVTTEIYAGTNLLDAVDIYKRLSSLNTARVVAVKGYIRLRLVTEDGQIVLACVKQGGGW